MANLAEQRKLIRICTMVVPVAAASRRIGTSHTLKRLTSIAMLQEDVGVDAVPGLDLV